MPFNSHEARRALRDDRRDNPRQLSPCVDQTPKEIETYYRGVTPGSPAVVRHTQGGMLVYDVTEVEGTNPKRGRVYVRSAGAFYMKSGKNCFHPTGQTTLVVPTEAVKEWAHEHPRGEFGVSTFRHYDAGDPD